MPPATTWPATADDWVRRALPVAFTAVRNELSHYSIVGPILSSLVNDGIREAVRRAMQARAYPRYFTDHRELRRWLCRVGYREAVRVLMLSPTVDAALRRLPAEDQRLLRWYYVDQFNDHLLHLMLGTKTRQEARGQLQEAFGRFCLHVNRLLEERGLARQDSPFPILQDGSL